MSNARGSYVPDIVLVIILSLLNDELSVKQHKATHDCQAKVHVSLHEEKGAALDSI